jgi:hypothetical protein
MDTLGTFTPDTAARPPNGAGGSRMSGAGRASRPAPPALGPPKRRRRPALWGLGLALIAGGGAAAAITVTAAGHRLPVLALVRAVSAGEPISAADLAVAHVAADPALNPVPASEEGMVTGLLAAVDLRPGTLLTREELSTVGIPTAGQALIGVSLKPGQLPARPLARGDRVLAVQTLVQTSVQDPASVKAAGAGLPAVVAEVGAAASDGTAVVDLVINQGDGPGLAQAASAGRLYLVLLPRAASQ